MAKVEIVDSLAKEIKKKFKGESYKIVQLLRGLEKNPNKGKPLGHAMGFTIKEIKHKRFRFYFILDRTNINLLSREELTNLLIRFIRMSNKNHQQKTVDEIKKILVKLGPHGFE
jgi:hypothetical protein